MEKVKRFHSNITRQIFNTIQFTSSHLLKESSDTPNVARTNTFQVHSLQLTISDS